MNFSIAMSSSTVVTHTYWSIGDVKSLIQFKPLTELIEPQINAGHIFHGRQFNVKFSHWWIRWFVCSDNNKNLCQRIIGSLLQMPSNANGNSVNWKQKLVVLLDSNINAICHHQYMIIENTHRSFIHSFIHLFYHWFIFVMAKLSIWMENDSPKNSKHSA